jgi:hypothetical protein
LGRIFKRMALTRPLEYRIALHRTLLMKFLRSFSIAPFCASFQSHAGLAAGKYQHFTAPVYARVYEVRQMKDLAWRELRRNEIARQVKIDKMKKQLMEGKSIVITSFLSRLLRNQAEAIIFAKPPMHPSLTVLRKNRFRAPAGAIRK